MEKLFRNLFLILLLLTALLLIGSGHGGSLKVSAPAEEQAASALADYLPRNDQKKWSDASRQRPLWLLRVVSY